MATKRSRGAFESNTNEPPPHAKYVLYGTPLPPYEPNARDDGSFVPEWKQEVTDERGRKRFHGAFTGGFSAGYFNTVGSKEGFVPKTFVSSRSKAGKDGAEQRSSAEKQQQQQQRLEDFMDEEDLAEHVASQRLEIRDAFAGVGGQDAAIPTDSQSSLDADGRDLFSKVFETSKADSARPETKGYQLLRKMSWRPGQGIGARVRRRAEGDRTGEMHLFAPQDVPMVAIVRKTDRKGIGYGQELKLTPIMLSTRIKPTARRKFGSVIKGGGDEKIKDRAISFDTADEDMDEFGPQIAIGRGIGGISDKKKKRKVDPSGKKKSEQSGTLVTRSTPFSRVCHDGRLPLKGFVLATDTSTATATPASEPPPVVPAGWKSTKTPRDTAASSSLQDKPFVSTSDAAKASTLDQRSRAALLGEALLPGKSVFDYLTPENRARIVAATGNQRLPAAGGETLRTSTTSSGPALQSETDRLWSLVPFISAETAAGALSRGEKGWLPYADDEAKRARYKAFLQLSAGNARGTSTEQQSSLPPRLLPTRPITFSIQDWTKELQEFAAAAEVFRPATGLLGKRFTSAVADPTRPSVNDPDVSADQASAREEDPAEKAAAMGMHGHLTRSRERFYPSRLLCKRFGVRPPPDAGPADHPEGDGFSGGRDDDKSANAPLAERLELVNRASMEKMMVEANLRRMKEASALRGASGPADAEVDLAAQNTGMEASRPLEMPSRLAEVDPERNLALEQEKPNAALFKSIFGESDDED